MAQKFNSLTEIYDHGFDAVIDVRSPAEFEEDHVPGAINLPSLSNAERVEVGTLYAQVSPFLARKLGASLVLNNIADHVKGDLKDHDGGWRPLIYCWRGGQRSGVFTTILKEIGWRAERIEGGYQNYRRLIYAALYESYLDHKIFLLDGYTGTAKTALLPMLKDIGVQTIDLEGLAGHRGSLLGAMPGGQPTQRMFESKLAHELARLDPKRPTVIEAESSKIGRINLPPSLWAKMKVAPRITLTASVSSRTTFLTKAYNDILRNPATVRERLAPLRRIRGHALVDHWQSLQDGGDFAGLARSLIVDHYDPAYSKSRAIKTPNVLKEIEMASLCHVGLSEAAKKIKTTLNAV